MRKTLGLCLKIDALAGRLYQTLARDCAEQELATFFVRMAQDEAQHTDWWEGLLEAFDEGLLPNLVSDTSDLTERLSVLHAELEAIDLDSLGSLSVEQMLALSARMEFFMIDPVFGELLELTEPVESTKRYTVYQAHVQRLVDEIARRFPTDSLAALLATSLARSWRDTMRLSAYATYDALTGLYNRRALYTHLPQWIAWSSRYGYPLTVLLIDIDHFKHVNDRYGHATGDIALQAVAFALREGVRSSDFVARYGGDEFAVIAPESGATECEELAGRLLDSVRSVELTAPNGDALRLTASIGATVSHDPAGSRPRSVESLLAAADKSLYGAKHGGRDRAGACTLLGDA